MWSGGSLRKRSARQTCTPPWRPCLTSDLPVFREHRALQQPDKSFPFSDTRCPMTISTGSLMNAKYIGRKSCKLEAELWSVECQTLYGVSCFVHLSVPNQMTRTSGGGVYLPSTVAQAWSGNHMHICLVLLRTSVQEAESATSATSERSKQI